MDLDTFIIAVFCTSDDMLKKIISRSAHKHLRERGPSPLLSDSEVITIEIIGEYLGLNQDKQIFEYFQHSYAHFFPQLREICRTTFVRQCANLWQVKEKIWEAIVQKSPSWKDVSIIDSMPVCRFRRAPRCKRFKGEAAFGKDHVKMQTFYGFRLHAIIQYPRIISRFSIEPANRQELAAAPELSEGLTGCLLGDRNYWSPNLIQQFKEQSLTLIAPFRSAKKDLHPKFSRMLSKTRYLIDTVFGQLTDRFSIKRIWAKDMWHLCNRLLRKVLCHTFLVYFNLTLGIEPLQFVNPSL